MFVSETTVIIQYKPVKTVSSVESSSVYAEVLDLSNACFSPLFSFSDITELIFSDIAKPLMADWHPIQLFLQLV